MKKPKTLQPNLFDLQNPPVKASVESSSGDRKEAPPLPQASTPIILPQPLCAWCYALVPCDCEERETSPNADPSSLTRAHPYKGRGVADGDKMSPDKWRAK